MPDAMHDVDLAIVGAGPVGLALGAALARSGLRLAMLDARHPEHIALDARVLALSQGSWLTLGMLGLTAPPAATPIRSIHVSQQGSAGRTLICAEDYGVDALGQVCPAGRLAQTLRTCVSNGPVRLLDETTLDSIDVDGKGVTLHCGGAHAGTLRARLVARAEGGIQSEAAASDAVRTRDYGQHALIATVRADGAPAGRAFERFTASGPIAFLPDGQDYALVHTVRPAEVAERITMDAKRYLDCLQHAIGTRLTLKHIGERRCYPLELRYRRNPVEARCVWLGNAAQTLHPVAGQGFNLALRDVWSLAETLLDASAQPDADIGSPATLDLYRRSRRIDRRGTIGFTDGLVRLFSNDNPALRHLRGAGLVGLDLLPPLRHFVARRMMFGARAWP